MWIIRPRTKIELADFLESIIKLKIFNMKTGRYITRKIMGAYYVRDFDNLVLKSNHKFTITAGNKGLEFKGYSIHFYTKDTNGDFRLSYIHPQNGISSINFKPKEKLELSWSRPICYIPVGSELLD